MPMMRAAPAWPGYLFQASVASASADAASPRPKSAPASAASLSGFLGSARYISSSAVRGGHGHLSQSVERVAALGAVGIVARDLGVDGHRERRVVQALEARARR